jgi:hypothetical protein
VGVIANGKKANPDDTVMMAACDWLINIGSSAAVRRIRTKQVFNYIHFLFRYPNAWSQLNSQVSRCSSPRYVLRLLPALANEMATACLIAFS